VHFQLTGYKNHLFTIEVTFSFTNMCNLCEVIELKSHMMWRGNCKWDKGKWCK